MLQIGRTYISTKPAGLVQSEHHYHHVACSRRDTAVELFTVKQQPLIPLHKYKLCPNI
jgi:hypothetical protein